MLRRVIAAAALSLVLTSCGDEVPDPTSVDLPTSTTEPAAEARIELVDDARTAPPIVLHTSGGDLDAFPSSTCWTSGNASGCADMVAPQLDQLVTVAGDDAITFTFPVKGWSFQASFSPVGGGDCDRRYTVDAPLLRDGEYSLAPGGPPGDYQVSIFGTGPQGDTGGVFRWRTDSAGVLPEPEASVSVVWAPHGELEGQGFQLSVTGLAVAPLDASVRITATAANGRSSTFEPPTEPPGCTGDLYLGEQGPDWADEVAALGPAPFTYAVTLTLDGVEHRASAVWPDDHVDDPYDDNPAPVPLTFDPPLR